MQSIVPQSNQNLSVPASAFEIQPRKEGIMYQQTGHATQDVLLLKETEGAKIAMIKQ